MDVACGHRFIHLHHLREQGAPSTLYALHANEEAVGAWRDAIVGRQRLFQRIVEVTIESEQGRGVPFAGIRIPEVLAGLHADLSCAYRRAGVYDLAEHAAPIAVGTFYAHGYDHIAGCSFGQARDHFFQHFIPCAIDHVHGGAEAFAGVAAGEPFGLSDAHGLS